ncbi:MAG: hypothetical protein LBU55_00035 [Elusimicrobiota bacterium]|jgi:uncharacterized protein (UPF0333 family)|nr:hypothetical protein [Elusimicrobiota bacterium]
MDFNKGQTLLEFLLVSVVLVSVVFGAFAMYKKYWMQKYERVLTPADTQENGTDYVK